MKLIKVTALAGSAAIALSGILSTTAAVAAPASSRPVVAYNTHYAGVWDQPTAWSHPASRPYALLSTGYATWGARHLSWSRWGARSATGHGQEFQVVESQRGDYITTYRASVSLWDVKTHHGLRYFAKMKISAHGHKTIRLTMRSGTWA